MMRFLLLVGSIVLFFFISNREAFLDADKWQGDRATTAPVAQNISKESATTTPPKKTMPIPALTAKVSAFISPNIPEITPKVTTPLVHYGEKASENALSSAKIIEWTNTSRAENKLAALSRNAQLDAAAIIKVRDMFNRQYFAHDSPSGKNSADLVSGVGYAYLWVGENLALGIFSGEKDLTDAWMASPGHRANILNAHFEEIGVGVDEGEYEGKHVWIAVQEFGKPSSSCPAPKETLKAEIETKRRAIDALATRANAFLAEIDALGKKNETEAYNRKVDEYNSTVGELNSLIKNTKALIEVYNAEINEYNACIEA